MKEESELDQIRADFEARQRNLLPGDNLRIPIAAESSPWNRKSAKRSDRLVLAVLFLLLAIGILAIPFVKDFEDGTVVAFIIALAPLFICYRLLHNLASSSQKASSVPKLK